MGEVLLAGKKAQKCATLVCDMVTDRSFEDRIFGFERIQHSSLRYAPIHFELYLTIHARQCAQMKRQCDPDHFSVCASTDSTAGRSRTIAVQLSPASDDP